jgi:hypothetical protein
MAIEADKASNRVSVEQGIGSDAFFTARENPLPPETLNTSWARAPAGPSRLSPFPIRQAAR